MSLSQNPYSRSIAEALTQIVTELPNLKGIDGTNGSDLAIAGVLNDSSELPASGNPGEGYIVGADLNLFVWDGDTFVDAGSLRGDKGDEGDPGREIELAVNSTHIQWKYVDEVEFTDLIALSELKGNPGNDGQSFEFTGIVTDVSELPASASEGDLWLARTDIYTWKESEFILLGSIGVGNVDIPGLETSFTPLNLGSVVNIEMSEGIKKVLRYLIIDTETDPELVVIGATNGTEGTIFIQNESGSTRSVSAPNSTHTSGNFSFPFELLDAAAMELSFTQIFSTIYWTGVLTSGTFTVDLEANSAVFVAMGTP